MMMRTMDNFYFLIHPIDIIRKERRVKMIRFLLNLIDKLRRSIFISPINNEQSDFIPSNHSDKILFLKFYFTVSFWYRAFLQHTAMNHLPETAVQFSFKNLNRPTGRKLRFMSVRFTESKIFIYSYHIPTPVDDKS